MVFIFDFSKKGSALMNHRYYHVRMTNYDIDGHTVDSMIELPAAYTTIEAYINKCISSGMQNIRCNIATEDEVTVWKANVIKRRPTFNGSLWYFVDDEVSIIFNTLELDGDGCTTGDICTKIITLSQEYLQQRYNIELDCQFTIVEDAKDHPSYSSLIADREIYHAYNTTYNKILVLNINNLYRPTREQTEELYRRGAY